MNELPPDQEPWLIVAQLVLKHGYKDSGKDTLEAIHIGLRSIQHPDCQAANEIVMGLMEERKKKKL